MTIQKPDKIRPDCEERRLALKKRIQDIGWSNIHVGEFASEFGVKRSQIYEDRNALIKAFKEEDINQISFELGNNYLMIIEEVRKIVIRNNANDNLKLRAIQVLLDAQDSYTCFLEAYGKKEKASERLRVENEDPANVLWQKLLGKKKK